jgi:S-DNA-T family DNA segregation ATPase FtsK/SpoIIIE
VRTHEPQDLRLALVDLKGGVEFTFYKKLPHLIDNDLIGSDELTGDSGLIKDGKDVIPLLRYLRREMDSRLMRFEKREVQTLQIWNYRRTKNRLPRLVLFIDELASVMLDPALKKEATRLLADITARGRAPGVHVVLATQRPEVKVVDGQIKGNIDARMAFRVTDNASSMVILDNTDAARFTDDTPPGRFIYRSGIENEEVQAPLITADQIRDVVAGVLEGDEREISRMSPEEIFRFSIDQLGGRFGRNEMYDALHSAGHEVAQHYLQRLASEYEGQVVEIGGELYELKPHAGPNPRHFEPVGSNGSSQA